MAQSTQLSNILSKAKFRPFPHLGLQHFIVKLSTRGDNGDRVKSCCPTTLLNFEEAGTIITCGNFLECKKTQIFQAVLALVAAETLWQRPSFVQ